MPDSLMSYLHPDASGDLDLLSLVDLPFYDKWSPKKEGERVDGVMTHRRTETWYDKPTDVLYVDTDDEGHVKIVCSSVVLARQVEAEDPQPGNRVHARFDGQGVSQTSGRTYNKTTFAKEEA